MVIRKAHAALLPLAIAIGVFPFFVTDLYFIHLSAGLFLYIALAESWNLIGGYAGYLSLGHATFVGLGAYLSAQLLVHDHISPFVSGPLGGALAFGIAVLIGFPTLRLRGPYFAVTTLAITYLAQLVFQNISTFGGGLGILMPPPNAGLRTAEMLFYWIFAGAAIVMVVAAAYVERSRYGLSLLALRNDEDSAATFGVNVNRAKLIAFGVSAFVAGWLGAIYAYQLGYIEPGIAFNVQMSISLVLMAMLGGAATWSGPVVGACVVYLLNQTLVFVIPTELSQVLFGAILIAVIFTMPNGIVGLVNTLRGENVFRAVLRNARNRVGIAAQEQEVARVDGD